MTSKLTLLTTSALAIPGILSHVHAAVPAQSEVNYRYTFYSEDDSPAARDSSNGAQERYKIQVHQFALLHPLNTKWAVSGEASYESMSGASPAASYVKEGTDEVYTEFAGASQEARLDLTGSVRRYWSEAELGGGAYMSLERDYFALAANIDGALQINNQMTTLSGGVSVGYDWLFPNLGFKNADGSIKTLDELTDAEKALAQQETPGRLAAYGENRLQLSAYEGVGQIINMNTVVQGSVSATFKSGYLSDPYRDKCDYAENIPCDLRPSTRVAGTFSLGGRRYFPGQDIVAALDYRLYADTWGIISHTVDVDVYKTFAPQAAFFANNNITFRLAPGVRYYQQKSAYFYEVPAIDDYSGGIAYDEDKTSYFSSDPRLAWYGALAAKGRLRITFRDFALVGLVERYAANPAYGFNFEADSDPAVGQIPGLPAYWRLSTGLDYKF